MPTFPLRATPTDDGTKLVTTACILCELNCGVTVELEGRTFVRTTGDKAHPGSQGYTCEKARQLDHYQNFEGRLTTPLRRREDGTFEEVDWDTAIAGVAADLAAIRDAHGGRSILYYGGGGQGNHLPGAYAKATRGVLGSTVASSALGQEKTGEFWVDGHLYGKSTCHTAGDWEHAEVLVFLGKNPWISHGVERARIVLKEAQRDPDRTIIVIDPRRSETAAMADVHLAVRPGTDANLLAAMLGIIVRDGLLDAAWLDAHAEGLEEVMAVLATLDVAAHAAATGLDLPQIEAVARRIATASSVSVYEDLGVQQGRHSTLNSYLEKLIYLLTGNFGVAGGMNLHTAMAPLMGSHSRHRSPVADRPLAAGLLACNHIPDEILTDHPDRFRALIVESGNPAHSIADSRRMREAIGALDTVVVIDVAMTETARLADWVLPASSQFEKAEATFFTTDFPENTFHLRHAILDPLDGTLPEAEIHRRLCHALGAMEGIDVEGLTEAASEGLEAYATALFGAAASTPAALQVLPVLLYETLGPALDPDLREGAVLFAVCHQAAQRNASAIRRAGVEPDGEGPLALGNALFHAVLDGRSGVVFSSDDDPAVSFERLAHEDGRVHLAIPELLARLASLPVDPVQDPAFPLLVAAGERRSYTANTIFRDPAWRKRDAEGAVRIHPADAEAFGVTDGGRVRIETATGAVEGVAAVTEEAAPGQMSLPNGQGLTLSDDDRGVGVAPNELTSSDLADDLIGTPWHKHVPARVLPVP
ncbi:molybdopterin-dependent oxidoreductase [Euzebya tangerina]|uniref:molybdopterin-dependent oxidoreductase n=1 Tax=Euzebya tangerina TaxID=591198 RepID=UPI000E315A1A|nr:molybdopterin-dependent oxidoreductase [Euzebya tangerina]